MRQAFPAFRTELILVPVVLGGTGMLIAALALWRRRKGFTHHDALTTSVFDGLTALVLAGPLALTLVPSGGLAGRSVDWIPLRSAWDQLTNPADAWAAVIQLAGNLFLLLPFGALAPIQWPVLDSVWRTLGATVLFGIMIEGLQFGMGRGREASMSDIALYVAGGLGGYVLSRAIRPRFAVDEGGTGTAS
jgi:glycopeptide antibiotics resistance protein